MARGARSGAVAHHTVKIDREPPLLRAVPLDLRRLFTVFNTAILIPILFRVGPTAMLLFGNVKALLCLFVYGKGVPTCLNSDFTFVSPMLLLLPLKCRITLNNFVVYNILFYLISFVIGGTKAN